MEPRLYEEYTTHKSGVIGWVMDIIPNPSGTLRLRLFTADLETRWTTYVPQDRVTS